MAAPLYDNLFHFAGSKSTSKGENDSFSFIRVALGQEVGTLSARSNLREYLATLTCSCALYFFKVAFSTFWFKFGATLRRQAERRGSGTRQKASNLAQPIS